MKILVLTDNLIIYRRVRALIEKIVGEAHQFDYAYSNLAGPIAEESDCTHLDVKKEASRLMEGYELIISAHCTQIFPAQLVENVRCVNIHPGYNPINRGWYPQVFAIINDLPVGVTIHEMDAKVDNGPIIARRLVEKRITDTSFDLYSRLVEAEIMLFEENLLSIISGDYQAYVPSEKGQIFWKKDFNSLCQLDLEEHGTFEAFYNRLRALTHGDFNNAYFIDPGTGKKVFVKLQINE